MNSCLCTTTPALNPETEPLRKSEHKMQQYTMHSTPEQMEWDLVLDGLAPKQGGNGSGTSPSMTSSPMSPLSPLSPLAKDNSMSGNSTFGVDPPRPPKEGYE